MIWLVERKRVRKEWGGQWGKENYSENTVDIVVGKKSKKKKR